MFLTQGVENVKLYNTKPSKKDKIDNGNTWYYVNCSTRNGLCQQHTGHNEIWLYAF